MTTPNLSHDKYYAAKYRRIASRREQVKAVVTIEHALLITVWNMLQTGETFNEPGGDFYSKRNPEKAKRRAIDQLRSLGYTVSLEPTATLKVHYLRVSPIYADNRLPHFGHEKCSSSQINPTE